jgi:diguanylate cyclase (GGDEF)-like protein
MLLNLFQIRTGDDKLSRAVRVALLEALFASRASLMVASVLGAALSSVVGWLCPSPWIIACGVLLTLSGILRVLSFGVYRPGSANANARKWELIYQLGALSYAMLLGQLTMLTILISSDLRLHLLTAVLSTGYSAGAAGRNTGRPSIAVGQLLLCSLPLSIALFMRPSMPNVLLAISNILFIIVITDITMLTYKTVLEAFIDRQEKLRLATVYEKLSKTDPLTGIDNRTTLKTNLEELLQRGDKTIAVIWLDLDRFKQINDTLGHAAGDLILHAVASRLAELSGREGKLARFGGDEFIVIIPVANADAGVAIADKIREALNEPVEADGTLIDISASIGLSVSAPGFSADKLLRHADVALYEAKARGRNCVELFDPEMEERLLNSKQIEHDLKRAIANGELELYFQPIINLKTGRVKSFEALLRWHHPINGDVPPSLFIPIAETSHSIGPITDWVLEKACAAAVTWPDEISVAVNISPALLTARRLPPVIYETLLKTGLHPRRLELEITETALVEDNPDTRIVLDGFQKLGISLSLDDFGTGYSSLSYLCRYSFDAIKIDRSFMADVYRSSESRAVIQAISSLATSLELTVVAEGIETLEQLEYICGQGCAAGQGYYFARPMPAAKVHEYLDRADLELEVLKIGLAQQQAKKPRRPQEPERRIA